MLKHELTRFLAHFYEYNYGRSKMSRFRGDNFSIASVSENQN